MNGRISYRLEDRNGMNINEQCLLNFLFNPDEINGILDAVLNTDYLDATALLPQNIFISFANFSN